MGARSWIGTTALGGALLLACGRDGAGPPSPDGGVDATPEASFAFREVLAPVLPCNTAPSLCDKAYDDVSYPMTHGSIAYANPPFACPAQTDDVRLQLDRGIRAIELEAHPSAPGVDSDGGEPLEGCLGSCDSGELPLGAALADVRAFLDVNPREVVTILIEGGADAGALGDAVTSAGLSTYALAHTMGDAWPTLDAMITQGTRVVILADVTGTPPPWMLPLWTYVAETGTAFTTTAAMTCDVARGAADAPLYLLNDYLVAAGTDPDGGEAAACLDPALVQSAGGEPFLMNRANACTLQHGKKATFVAVDDFGGGDVLGAVQALNGLL
jgi:hypothetical protein